MTDEASNYRKYIKNFLIFVAIVVAYTLLSKALKSKTNSELWNAPWTTHNFKELGIKLNLPVDLDQVGVEGDSRGYGFESPYLLISLASLTVPDELDVSINEVATRHLDKFASSMGFTTNNLTDEPQSNGISNVIAGQVTFNNQEYELTHMCINRGTSYYIIIVYYIQGDEYGKKIKDRILSSIEL